MLKLRFVCSPNGGAITVPGPACVCVEARWTKGGTCLIPTDGELLPLAPAYVINVGKWNLPAQSRRRHRGRRAGAQAWTHRDQLLLDGSHTPTHPGLDSFLKTIQINEGETLVSEVISEIQHGSQSECEV